MGFWSDPVFDALFARRLAAAAPAPAPAAVQPPAPSAPVAVSTPEIQAVADGAGGWTISWFDGEKFTGGYGATKSVKVDYWTLRARSKEMWYASHFARGFIERIVTNKINTGLEPEAQPVESVLGVPRDSLDDWTDAVEEAWDLWSSTPELCDYYGRRTFGQLQDQAETEAAVAGDCLWVQRAGEAGAAPRVQLIEGSLVRTPIDRFMDPLVRHGVELNQAGSEIGYWVQQDDGTFRQIPAYAPNGIRIAWLHRSGRELIGAVRGQPLLSNVLQSMKEIDRFRDSVQRKAVMSSMLALVVEREQPGVSVSPFGGGAVRSGVATDGGPTTTTSTPRTYNIKELLPGTIVDEMPVGAKIKAIPSTGTDEKYGDFESAVMSSMAWSKGIPPEIMFLTFSSNYSASQAAISELRNSLEPERENFAVNNCQPSYIDWLAAEVLSGRILAPGFVQGLLGHSYADRMKLAAWCRTEWTGPVKPMLDPVKMAKGQKLLIGMAATHYGRSARELTGTSFTKNIRRLAKERAAAQALGLRLDDEKPTAPPDGTTGMDEMMQALDEIKDALKC